MPRWPEGELEPCGSNAAYARHQKAGEPIDEPCRRAHARYVDENRAKRPEAALLWARRKNARNRALSRLAKLYPEVYEELYLDEAEKEGVEPW